MRFRTLSTAAAAVAALGLAAGGAAWATPGSGTTTTDLTIGALPAKSTAKQDGITFRAKPATSVVAFTLTYAVGADSGWHSHPGIVIGVVQSGTIVRQVGCRTETFTAGQAFTEVAPHDVRNLYTSTSEAGAVPAVLKITQIVPADVASRRLEADAPTCPKPSPYPPGHMH